VHGGPKGQRQELSVMDTLLVFRIYKVPSSKGGKEALHFLVDFFCCDLAWHHHTDHISPLVPAQHTSWHHHQA
jgi:hypothetical protein